MRDRLQNARHRLTCLTRLTRRYIFDRAGMPLLVAACLVVAAVARIDTRVDTRASAVQNVDTRDVTNGDTAAQAIARANVLPADTRSVKSADTASDEQTAHYLAYYLARQAVSGTASGTVIDPDGWLYDQALGTALDDTHRRAFDQTFDKALDQALDRAFDRMIDRSVDSAPDVPLLDVRPYSFDSRALDTFDGLLDDGLLSNSAESDGELRGRWHSNLPVLRL